jgi:phage terminase large subunit-like protein
MEALFALVDKLAAGSIDMETVDRPVREGPRKLERREAENKLVDYSPYTKQLEFHDAGAQYRERLFLAGNRCITPWTALQTDHGERLAYEILGEPGFGVQSWDGSSRRTRRASNVFLRGIEPAFQIHLDNGEVFQCSGRHLVFANGCSAAPHLSGWVSIDRLIHELNARHYFRTSQGWRASCDADVRQDDGPLRRPSGSDRSQPPRRSGAPNNGPCYYSSDALASITSHIRVFPMSDLHASSDEAIRTADLCGQTSAPAAFDFCLSRMSISRFVPQSRHGLSPERAEWEESVLRQLRGLPRVSSVLLASRLIPVFDGNSILAVIPLGLQPIVDFEVEKTHNYVAAGVVHHNCGKTMAGAFELAIHLTGAYPNWWGGKRFDKPVRAWAAGITGESTRDVVQEKLLGPPDRRDAWGTGAIPKANLGEILMGRGIANAIDLVPVKHISGDWSSLAFKSYEKGREKWQGAALEVVWMDEEPPSDLYYEALTRTNETSGIVYITCTPLLGMSDVMRMFLMDATDHAKS